MAFNKVFNQEEIARLKKLITEGDQVLYEVDALNTGLRETVKAIAEEMDLKPAVLMKAIKLAHKAKFQDDDALRLAMIRLANIFGLSPMYTTN